MCGNIITDIPISLLPSVSFETYLYTRIPETNNITRIFSQQELYYVKLSPPNCQELNSYEIVCNW